MAQELGVSPPTLYKWKQQLLGHDTSALMTRDQDPVPSPERDDLEQQVEALRRNIRHLQLERDLLKKAALLKL